MWFATSAGMAPGDGSLAERCAVSSADLVQISAEVPDATVAALGTSAIAAWMSLTWRAKLQPGERVVVLGASGAVGQVALSRGTRAGSSQSGRGLPVGTLQRSGRLRRVPTRSSCCVRTSPAPT